MRRLSPWLAAAAVALAAACGAGDPLSGPGAEPCVGKCDGVLSGDFVDLFKNPKKVGPGDLTKVAADLVTNQINDLLANVPYYSPRLSKTELYALSARAEDSYTLESLPELTAGLTKAYGEAAFSTRINALRQQHLQQHPEQVWAEAHFSLPTDPSIGVTLDSFGDSTASLRFGFAGLDQDISATVIAPYDGSKSKGLAKALIDAPARAVLAALGGLPSSLEDFRAMKPGQLIALRSSRGLGGFNINGSTPLYLATIATHATLWARISAAASIAARADLDVQMIRDVGQRLVVDVGLTAHGDKDNPNMAFSLAMFGRWGVQALDLYSLELGPLSVDLGSIVRKTIRKQLNKRFTPFSARASFNPKVKTRHTIARYAFDLSPNLPAAKRQELRRALALASNGVLYYAQYLAKQPASGVSELVSVDRIARTPNYYVGLDLPVLGMSFHLAKKRNVGDVQITIGAETQQIFWNEVEKKKGWFFTKRDYRVTGLASVRSLHGAPVDADHNLRLRLIEKQGSKASRDDILDHVDPLLATFIGSDKLAVIDAITRKIQLHMAKSFVCGSRDMADPEDTDSATEDDRQCLIARANSAEVKAWTAQARTAFEAAIAGGALAGGLDPRFQRGADFARALFELKLRAQTLPEDPDFSGPKGKMRVEARFTAVALERMLAAPDAKARFEAALRQTVYELNRRRRKSDQKDEFEDINASHKKAIRKVVARFGKAVQGYVMQRNLGRLSFRSQEGYAVTVGDQGLIVSIDENGQLAQGGSGAMSAMATIAERKAASLTAFFEDLVDEAEPKFPLIGRLFSGLGTTEHQILGYTLLRLAKPWETELLVDMRFEKAPIIDVPNVKLYGRGAEAKLIDAGQFDLDALIAGN